MSKYRRRDDFDGGDLTFRFFVLGLILLAVFPPFCQSNSRRENVWQARFFSPLSVVSFPPEFCFILVIRFGALVSPLRPVPP